MEHFFQSCERDTPRLQVRSDKEEALKHGAERRVVNKYTWNTVTPVWKLLHPLVEVKNSVRAMKEMIQCQKDAVFSLGIEFLHQTSIFLVVGATLSGS